MTIDKNKLVSKGMRTCGTSIEAPTKLPDRFDIDGYWIEFVNLVANPGQHPNAQSNMYCWQNSDGTKPCRVLKISFVCTSDPNTPLRRPGIIPGTQDYEFFMHVSMSSAILAMLKLGPCEVHFEPQADKGTPYGSIELKQEVEI